MSCPTTKALCDNLIISQAITFANNQLTINLPSGSYNNGQTIRKSRKRIRKYRR